MELDTQGNHLHGLGFGPLAADIQAREGELQGRRAELGVAARLRNAYRLGTHGFDARRHRDEAGPRSSQQVVGHGDRYLVSLDGQRHPLGNSLLGFCCPGQPLALGSDRHLLRRRIRPGEIETRRLDGESVDDFRRLLRHGYHARRHAAPSAETVIRPLRCSGALFPPPSPSASGRRSARRRATPPPLRPLRASTPRPVLSRSPRCVPLSAPQGDGFRERPFNDCCSVPLFPSQETIRKAAKAPINTCVLIISYSINRFSFCRLTFRHSAASAAAAAPFAVAGQKSGVSADLTCPIHLTCTKPLK